MNKIEKLSTLQGETNDFASLIDNIYQTHEYLNIHAVKSVNICLTMRNFLFGYHIVEYEQKGNDRAKYGDKLLESIAKELWKKGLKNVSAAELSRFRQFYTTYPQIRGTVSQELQITDYLSVDPVKLVSNIVK